MHFASFAPQDLTSTAGVAASFVGTANYMSPERALGKDTPTSPRLSAKVWKNFIVFFSAQST